MENAGKQGKIHIDKTQRRAYSYAISTGEAPQAPPQREEKMFEVTEKASEMIKEYLKSRTEAPSIRILMQAG